MAWEGYLYILKDWNLENTYKIGVTKRRVQQRIKELNQCPGATVKLDYLSPLSERYRIVEKKLHKLFKSQNTFTGENPALREWFVLSEDQYKALRLVLKYEFEV